jgi:hypothetical protein
MGMISNSMSMEKLANEGKDPFPAEGKILLQSEGAEVFFRNITLYPLKK